MRFVARSIPVLFVALMLLPSTASAQFGGLLKKAKAKVMQQANDKPGAAVPGEQVNDALLTQLMTGLRAADVVTGKRDELQAERRAKSAQLADMQNRTGPARAAYLDAKEKVSGCRSSTLHDLEKARTARFDKQMHALQRDPVAMAKMQMTMMKYGQAIAEAQRKNDPAALATAQTNVQRDVLGIDIMAEMKKDTVAADAKCGTDVAPPAAIEAEDDLRKQIADIDSQSRVLEAQAVNAGAQAAGMDRVRYTELKERVQTIFMSLSRNGGPQGFGAAEIDAVNKHRDEIEKLKHTF